MNKKDLSERDICTKYITPAVKLAGWDEMTQVREEVNFTKGHIIVPQQAGHLGQGQARRLYPLLQAKHPVRSKNSNCLNSLVVAG